MCYSVTYVSKIFLGKTLQVYAIYIRNWITTRVRVWKDNIEAEELSTSEYESVYDNFAVMSKVQKIFYILMIELICSEEKFCTWDKSNSTMRSGLLINLIKCLRSHKLAAQPDISPFMIISECKTLPQL